MSGCAGMQFLPWRICWTTVSSANRWREPRKGGAVPRPTRFVPWQRAHVTSNTYCPGVRGARGSSADRRRERPKRSTDVIGADEQPSRRRVNASARPLRPAVDAKEQIQLALAEGAKPAGSRALEDAGHMLERFLRALGEIGGGELHLGERFGPFGVGLVGPGFFAGQIAGGGAAKAKGKDRFARHAIQQQRVADLGDGGHDINAPAVPRERDEVGRRGMSRSQRSCPISWKCQRRVPVLASSATTQLANRF